MQKRNGFSLIEVLLAAAVLPMIVVPLFNLQTKILLRSKLVHEKLIRILPMANSLNSISLLEDINKGLEKKELGPETKITLTLEELKDKSFKNLKNLKLLVAEEKWQDNQENLYKILFIKPEKKEDNKDKDVQK